MPIYLDPKGKFDLVLKSDAGKDPAPSFRFRYLNGRKWMRVAEMQDKIAGSGSGAVALGLMFDAIRLGLCGWKDVVTVDPEIADEFEYPTALRPKVGDDGLFEAAIPLPYKPDLLDLILNPAEAQEVLQRLAETIRPTEADLGKSESPAP
jgi:hypothetical protein